MNIYTAKFTAFVYRWNQKSTGKWYIGSRTAKNCHIEDGYLCSSKIVKPLIESNPDDWSREILAMGESKFMIQVEAEILQELNAKEDTDSYNLHNGNGKYSMTGRKLSPETRDKMSEANRRRGPRSEETKAKQRAATIRYYQNLSTEEKDKNSVRLRSANKNMSPETRAIKSAKISAANKNMSPEAKSIKSAKISEYNLRRDPASEATRAKMRAAKLGKTRTRAVCHIDTRREYAMNTWVQYFTD